ncbi:MULTISPECIES: transporter associated domain-containing protein [unclassified Tardiphaga]|uniref:transporter associated domain-containing protein n=1 Tax=unclassified Tardiphaga TaxID=2631404 RepID=UPI001FED5336|nr:MULTISPECIES: transporter associated domain-containing protein [unclassified Tardiphaga]
MPDGSFFLHDDGSYLIAGWMPAVDFAELLHIELPLQQRPYQTFAGFLLQEFGKIADEGDHVVAHGWRFEVMDLDGRRIDKVLASQAEEVALG